MAAQTVVRRNADATATAVALAATATGLVPRPSATAYTCEVYANKEWQDTGISVIIGQRVSLVASGQWSHGLSESGGMYGPGGYDKYENAYLLPQARVGSLVGKIGLEPPFLIGTGTSFVANVEGLLQLSMNDVPGSFYNNDGSVRVQIEVQ